MPQIELGSSELIQVRAVSEQLADEVATAEENLRRVAIRRAYCSRSGTKMLEMIPDPKLGVSLSTRLLRGLCFDDLETYAISCPRCANADLLNLDDLPNNPTPELERLMEAYKTRVRLNKRKA
jgi:hypothetical protein